MRKNFGTKPWFYPLPVLIIGTYDESGKADVDHMEAVGKRAMLLKMAVN